MPADKTKKLKPNDRIVAVGQGTNEAVDVVQMPLNKVVDMIRGRKGTMVHLVVEPAGNSAAKSADIVLKRDVVSIKYSFDERITDGLYCAKSLEIFKQAVENPETLDAPSSS